MQALLSSRCHNGTLLPLQRMHVIRQAFPAWTRAILTIMGGSEALNMLVWLMTSSAQMFRCSLDETADNLGQYSSYPGRDKLIAIGRSHQAQPLRLAIAGPHPKTPSRMIADHVDNLGNLKTPHFTAMGLRKQSSFAVHEIL
jgi:hypothetical protein